MIHHYTMNDRAPYYRPSSEIERQIAEFKSTLPEGITAPPPGDFAGQLQWDAWQGHLAELQTELDVAIAHELADLFHDPSLHYE